MDVSHDFGRAEPLDPRGEPSVIRSHTDAEAAIFDELLASPDCPRELLVAALQESRRRFDSLISAVSGTFFRCDLSPPYVLEFPDSKGTSITGYPLESITSDVFSILIHPEDIVPHREAIAQAIKEKTSFAVTYRLRHKSGEFRWVRSRGKAVYDEHGVPQFFEGFVADITEKMELKLAVDDARRDAQALNTKLSHMLESTLDCVMAYDREWNLTYANGKATEEIRRNGISNWSGNLKDLVTAQDSDWWDVVNGAMETREPARVEAYSSAAGGWFEIYAAPDEDGITMFHRDISQRKQLEEEKAKQAENLRTTLDSIPDMVWATDSAGLGQYGNRALAEFTGISREAFMRGDQIPDKNMVHPEDRQQAIRLWKIALASGRAYQAELRMRHHSGNYRWILSRAWPQRNGDGEIVKWYGSATDIHERVVADRKLRESEILQGSILDSTPDYVLIIDLEGKVLTINTPRCARKDCWTPAP